MPQYASAGGSVMTIMLARPKMVVTRSRAVEAGEPIVEDDAADDDDGRHRGRFQRDREALDDVGAGPVTEAWAIETIGH